MKALADAFFHRVSQAAWLANRTGGKTRNFSLLHHANSTFNDALWTLHAATQEEQALQCKQYLEEYFSADWFAPLALGKPAASVRRYTNRARVTVRPGTINAFSGPKPQVLGLDEVEFLPWLNFQQSIGMPHSTDAFPALLLLGSTRQRTHGTMQRLTDNAARMGLEMYTWCVWEVMEPCQTRSKDCPLWERCRGGQLCQNPDGFMKVRDVIQKAALWDDEAWETQGLCQRPSRRGLVYWMLDPAVHVHAKWDYRPTLPVYLSADWGYSSPASIGFYQDTPEAGWKFDEIYITHQLGEQLLGLVLEKQKQYGCRFASGWGDPENAEHNARFRKGLAIPWLAGNNVIEEKVRSVRARLRPAVGPPTLFFHPRCVNTLREFNLYHQRETGTLADGTPTYAEDPVDEENHAMDELAYYCWGRRREHRLSMADSIIVTPTGAPARFPGDAASGPGPAQRPTGKAW